MTAHDYSQLKAVFQFDFPDPLDEVFSTLWTEKYFDRYELITESGPRAAFSFTNQMLL